MFKRFNRLGLRALLLFAIVGAIVVAFWHRSSQRQKMLVEGIREYEGNVAYDWQIDLAKHDFIPNATPPHPSWLVDCFGEDYFYSVHFAQVNLSQPDRWNTFAVRAMLGVSLLGQERFAEAETLLVEGYEGMKSREATIPPPGRIRVPESLDRLIELYTRTGKSEQVAKYRTLREAYSLEVFPSTPNTIDTSESEPGK